MTSPPETRPRQAAMMLLSGGGRAVVGFVANLILARLLQPEAFGEVALVLATVGMCSALLSPRLSVLILREPDTEEGHRRIEAHLAVAGLSVLAIFLVALAALSLGGQLSPWSLLLTAGVSADGYLSCRLAHLERQQRYRGIAGFELGQLIAGNLLAIGLALAGAGAIALYLRELVRTLLLAGWLRSVEGGRGPGPIRLPRRDQIRGSLAAARYVWPDGLIEMGLEHSITLACGFVGGARGAGHFTLAYRLARTPHQLLQPVFVRLALNWFSRADTAQARARLRGRLTLLAAAALIPAGVVTALWAEPIVSLIYGSDWRETGELLVWMAGVVVFFPLANMVKTEMYASVDQMRLWLLRTLQVVGLVGPALLASAAQLPALAALALGISSSRAVMTFGGHYLLYLGRDRTEAKA